MQNKKLFIGGLAALTLIATMLTARAQTKSYFIPSGSMLPNLPISSTIQVKLAPYQTIADVKRGDVITNTRVEGKTTVDSVKRVIGLPGDKIAMKGTMPTINGRALSHQKMRAMGKVTVYLETNGATEYPVQYGDNLSPNAPFSVVVPAGKLFCLGDNRDNSYDSRYVGSVAFGSVTGKKVP